MDVSTTTLVSDYNLLIMSFLIHNPILTQEYINGIKDGTYKKVEIPKNDENTSSSKSRDILDDYKEIRWSNKILSL